MARQPRLILPNQPHHIIQRGNDGQLVFREPEDYEHFLGWLKEASRFYSVAVHASGVMPNHLNMLATPGDAEGLGLMMQKLGRLDGSWFKSKYTRSGGLFQGGFRASQVGAES